MLIKAQFVQNLGVDSLDHQFLFTISEEDLSLLGVKAVRDWDVKWQRMPISRNLTDDVYDEVRDLHRRGFVVRLPFRPDTYDGLEPYPGQMHTLRPEEWYWVMIEGPFQTETTFENKVGRQRLIHSMFDGVAIYPWCPDAQYFSEQLEVLDELPHSFYHAANSDPLTSMLLGHLSKGAGKAETVLSQKHMDWWFRLWGAIVGFVPTKSFIDTGNGLYSKVTPTTDLSRWYNLFSKTTNNPKSNYYAPETPLASIIRELSNPKEFGAMGVLLPYAMIANPYAFVGPCSNPGIGSATGNAASVKLFPFWLIDIFARSAYGLPYKHKGRATAVVSEAIAHLEHRNHQAFAKYIDGKPTWGDSFNFDKDGLIPNGSTIFSKATIQNAVLRRNKELELVRKGVVKRTYISDRFYPNPYRALAGLSGTILDTIPVNDAVSQQSLDKISTKILQVDTADKQRVYQWRGLRGRVDVNQEIADLILEQAVSPHNQRIIRVNPPITSPVPGNTQKIMNAGQAAASRMVIRKRVSCVTGSAGTGKSHFLHELERFSRELTHGGEITCLLLLTPTNVAYSRICQLFPDESVYVFGGREDAVDDLNMAIYRDSREDHHEEPPARNQPDQQAQEPLNFRIAVGTIDSFLGKLKASPALRNYLRERNAIVGVDECGMVTAEKFSALLNFYRDNDSNGLSERLLRLVLTGDPAQLLSVEPGNFFSDMLRFCAVAMLTEQMRYASDDPTKISLETVFGQVRAGMTSEADRVEVVKTLIKVAKQPDIAEGHIRVYLLNDLPSTQPDKEGAEFFWQQFVNNLEQTAQQIVFKEIEDWNRVELSGGTLSPRIPIKPKSDEVRQANADYEKFRSAFTESIHPFQIVTLTRRARSASGQTEYISSADRVNGWVHDALLGRLPQDIGYRSCPLPPNERAITKFIGTDRILSPKGILTTYDKALEEIGSNRTALRQFLADNRPNGITLFRNWPYRVCSSEFKEFGVYRGNVIRYQRIVQKRNKNYYVFTSPDGYEFAVGQRYCTQEHLTYGWANNVHQVQGAEYPLVVLLWLDGICFPFIANNWKRLHTADENMLLKPLEQFRYGGMTMGNDLASLDDKLDSRAFYTATTRTSMRTVETSSLDTGMGTTQQKLGRCVIVAGKHALRRYLSLQVHERRTPLFGMIWERLHQRDTT